MTEFERLVKQANKAAQNMGGLVSILLAIQSQKGFLIEWDADKARFIVDGKTISITAIRAELLRMESSIANTIISYNNKLWSKEWTLAQWRKNMSELTEDSHTLFGALAAGGIVIALRNPTVVRRRERDLKALKGFATAKRQNTIPSLAMMQNRSRAYIRSFYVTYQLLSQRAHILAGYTEARRVLTPAEHCRSKNGVEGCIEVYKKMWMPIRDMPPIGTLVCMQFCKCYILYR